MRGRVEAVRRHIEARFNLGDQLDIRTKRVQTNNVFEVVLGNIFYENCDIAIAMSSSCADPLLGLNIPSYCPGWRYLSIKYTH